MRCVTLRGDGNHEEGNEVNWGVFDFVAMAGLLLGFGGLAAFIIKRTSRKGRVIWLGAVAIAFVYIWLELAVGVFFSFGS